MRSCRVIRRCSRLLLCCWCSHPPAPSTSPQRSRRDRWAHSTTPLATAASVRRGGAGESGSCRPSAAAPALLATPSCPHLSCCLLRRCVVCLTCCISMVLAALYFAIFSRVACFTASLTGAAPSSSRLRPCIERREGREKEGKEWSGWRGEPNGGDRAQRAEARVDAEAINAASRMPTLSGIKARGSGR